MQPDRRLRLAPAQPWWEYHFIEAGRLHINQVWYELKHWLCLRLPEAALPPTTTYYLLLLL